MADSVDLTDVIVPTMEEIQNMKVADLKKKLKEFGLPITGNKTELVERLQLACLSSKELDSFDNSQLSLDESQINELESADNSTALEDSDLLLFNSSSYISSSREDSKILDGAENNISNSASVTMPPKKRNLSKADSEGTGVEKKVQLNRTNVTHIDFSIKPASDSKPVTVSSDDDKDGLEEKKVLTSKNMSAAERLAMRAKRFNVNDSAITTNNSTTKSTNSRNSKQSILSSSVAPDLDVLKKRAERFGQSVSTVMKQIEQKEKLLKRKCKFGASLAISATSSLDEQEKKRMRAERFGIS